MYKMSQNTSVNSRHWRWATDLPSEKKFTYEVKSEFKPKQQISDFDQ